MAHPSSSPPNKLHFPHPHSHFTCSAAERADLAEYRALTDPVFIAEMARDNRVRAYAALSDALGGKTKGVAALLMVRVSMPQLFPVQICS
jgi:hypothetical protein